MGFNASNARWWFRLLWPTCTSPLKAIYCKNGCGSKSSCNFLWLKCHSCCLAVCSTFSKMLEVTRSRPACVICPLCLPSPHYSIFCQLYMIKSETRPKIDNSERNNVGWPYVLFSPDRSSFWTYKNASGRDFLIAQNVRDSAVFLILLPLNFWPLPPAPAIFVSTPLNILILYIILAHQGAAICMWCI